MLKSEKKEYKELKENISDLSLKIAYEKIAELEEEIKPLREIEAQVLRNNEADLIKDCIQDLALNVDPFSPDVKELSKKADSLPEKTLKEFLKTLESSEKTVLKNAYTLGEINGEGTERAEEYKKLKSKTYDTLIEIQVEKVVENLVEQEAGFQAEDNQKRSR